MQGFKKMQKVKAAAAGIAAVMAFTCLSGCSGGKQSAKVDLDGEIPKELSIFSTLGANVSSAGGSSFNDTTTFQLLEEKTGCHVEWQHPAAGAEKERFNMMIASGEYPDAIVYNWTDVNGGIDSYVDDGVIVDLTPYIEECMPNFSELLSENPEFKKSVMTDDGKILAIPYIRKDKQLCIYQGTLIRQDWLDKLGLEAPTTPEELEKVLMAFKTQDPNGNGKADEIPWSAAYGFDNVMGIGPVLWAFNTTYDFHLKDGKVVYGPTTDAFKEGITYLARLYSEGLIDPDYLTNDRAKMDAKYTSDISGFGFGFQPSTYYSSMNDGKRKVSGIGYLKSADGKNYCYNDAYVQPVMKNVSLAVTSSNKNVAGTLKWLDNLYGGDGMLYANYGEEGKNYEMKDGEPVFTEYMTKNSDGKTLAQMVGLTCAVRDSAFPMLQTWQFYKQTLQPWGVDAIETWMNDNADTSNILPQISRTQEESERFSELMNPIKTYMQEQANKVITGAVSPDDWDKVVAEIKKMGIDEVLEIQNAAYERYLKR